MVDQGFVKGKLIEKYQAGWVGITSFSANGGSNDVTSALTTALTTAGYGGSAVTLQNSTAYNVDGVIVASPLNRVPVRVSGGAIQDADGLEIYARITEATGTYTLTYYVNDEGVQTAHSFGGATTVDVYIPYRYTFGSFPTDTAIAIPAFDVTPDPAQVTAPIAFSEELTAGTNTVTDLTNTPVGAVELVVDGVSFSSVATPAPFTISGTTITWSATNAKVSLDSSDTVIANYEY